MATTVINIKDAPHLWSTGNQGHVYIGRKRPGFSGAYGNPFILPNEKSRNLVIKVYTEWFFNTDNIYFRDLVFENLKDKILVCYCKPKACHGDVIAEYVDNLHLGM